MEVKPIGYAIGAVDIRDIAMAGKMYLRHWLHSRKHEDIPSIIAVETTNKCNRNCEGCYIPKNGQDITWSLLRKIVEEVNKLNIPAVGIIGGEPLLDLEHIKVLKRLFLDFPKNYFFVYTNGDAIVNYTADIPWDAHNVSYSISVNGLETTHDLQRGIGSFKKVERAFQILRQKQKFYGAAITVGKANEEEILAEEFIEKLDSWNVNYVNFMKRKDEGNELEGNYFLQLAEGFKYLARDTKFVINVGGINRGHSESSHFRYMSFFVQPNGDVRRNKTRLEDKIGNLEVQTLAEIISGGK